MVLTTATTTSGIRLEKILRAHTANEQILNAFRRVPRDYFLSPSFMPNAGADTPLPIGHSQTTSSPSVIAKMLDMLFSKIPLPSTILEIGAGCGYQTALLAEMGCEVVGVERIRLLANQARQRLKNLGYTRWQILHADGAAGHPTKAPYGGIIICAECDEMPPTLVKQLSPTSHAVLPLRKKGQVQLCLVNSQGQVVEQKELVNFVPLLKGLA